MDDRIIKLTSAVYNLLEYFPESDPLKNKAKEKALAILENLKPEDVDILLGYLKIAKMQGWLNSVNYLIITNEYEKIKRGTGLKKENEQKTVRGQTSRELTNRQQEILDFLEKNKKAQVMDLQKILPNVTKRTIRRDLDKLLMVGQIERDGTFNQIIYKIKVSH